MRNLIFRAALIAVLMVSSISLRAQYGPRIPIDPQVRYGKLPNGLTYYIRHNEEPEHRAEFYIAQNVGAILENDNQNGLAHFLEHMCFNGTKNFPGKALINYLEKLGVKFGENINAYTDLDETVYNLSDVPVTRPSVVDSALLILHDWSGFITLDPKEIDAERGVILEEWRTRAGAMRRMWKESNALKYPGSQYAKRDIIGDTAVIKHFKYQTLRNFYHKWYRPDEQAILVVGDVNVDTIQKDIKRIFADIKAKPNAGERPIYQIANNRRPIIALVKDEEAQMTRIYLQYKHNKLPVAEQKSISGYTISVINSLISNMMANRFDEITQKPDAPFVGALAEYGELVKSKDAFSLLAVPKQGKEEEGIMALLLQAQKIKRYGFTNSELERAKTDLLTSVEKAYNDKDHQKNKALVREYVRNFLNNEPIPGIAWEYSTLKQMLPHLTTIVVNRMAKSYVTDTNLIVTVMSPDKKAVKVPTQAEIREMIAESYAAKIKPPVDENINKPLISKEPVAGKIEKVTQNKELGTTEWLLSNGAKVIFKPTTFKKDEILMTAFSQGGYSKVKNPANLVSASLATNIVMNNGLGDFSEVDLNKVLTGKIASVTPYISRYSEGFNGSSSVNDYQTMLQLIYLYFTGVRKDDNAYKALINMYDASLANSANDPRKAFSDTIMTWVYSHSPRTVLMNLNALKKVNQDTAIKIFKERFLSPSDFTFIFTGNVDPQNDTVKTEVCTYLGGIKAPMVSEKFTDNGIRRPKGIVKKHFEQEMKINRASNLIYYSGLMPYNLENQTVMKAIGNILNIRYVASAREREGGTYGVGVMGSISDTPIPRASLLMQFDTDPKKEAKILGIIYQEVDSIVKDGPKVVDLEKVKENLLKEYNEHLQENSWWQKAVRDYYQDNFDLLKDYKKTVKDLTPDLIQKKLKSFTDQGNILEVVMTPKK